jgi:hypothetical protein
LADLSVANKRLDFLLVGGTMSDGANINFLGFDGDGNPVTATYNLNGILRN